MRYLSAEQVIRAHQELMLEEGQQSVLTAPEKLEAAIARPQASVFGEDAYSTLAEKAAALLESLAIGHPFVDGNKRLALTAMDTFLALNRFSKATDEDATVELVLDVASGKLKGVDAIARRLRVLYGHDLK